MLDVETDAYIHCISAFVKLAQSEYQLLTDVIPEHHQKKTFDSLIQVLPCRALGLGGSCPCRSLRLCRPKVPSPQLQLSLPPQGITHALSLPQHAGFPGGLPGDSGWGPFWEPALTSLPPP